MKEDRKNIYGNLKIHMEKNEEVLSKAALDILQSCTDKDMCVFIPEKNKLYCLLKEITGFLSDANNVFDKIFIVSDTKNTKFDDYVYGSILFNLISDLSLHKDKVAFEIIKPNESFDNIRKISDALSNNFLKTCIIFENLTSLEEFEKFIVGKESFMRFFDVKLYFTNSPIFFADLYSKKYDYNFYAAYKEREYNNFYSRFFENSEIIAYDSPEKELYKAYKNKGSNTFSLIDLFKYISSLDKIEMEKMPKDVSFEEVRNIREKLACLISNSVFCTDFITNVVLKDKRYGFIKSMFSKISYCSSKLDAFFKLIVQISFDSIAVVFDSKFIRDMVSSIARFRLNNAKLVVKDVSVTLSFEGASDEKERIIYFLLEDKCLDFDKDLELYLLWDVYSIDVSKHKFIFLSEDRKSYIEELITNENKIMKELKHMEEKLEKLFCKENVKIKDGIKPMSTKNVFSVKIYDVEKLTSKFFEDVKEKTQFNIISKDEEKCFIEIEKKNNFSLVGIVLNRATGYPISFKNMKYFHRNCSFLCKDIHVGVLSGYSTFTNSVAIRDVGIVFVNNDDIILYVFSREKNYKFVFNSSSLDKTVIFDKRVTSLRVFLTMNLYPSVYASNSNISILKRNNIIPSDGESSIDQNKVDSQEWARCSIKEVLFMSNRYDFCLEIDIANKYNQNSLKNIIFDPKNPFMYAKKYGNSKLHDDGYNIKENVLRNKEKIFYDENERKIKLYDQFDTLVRVFLSLKSFDIIFSSVQYVNNAVYSYESILKYFNSIDPLEYYYILCLVSQKARYLCFQVTEEDLNQIKNSNIINTAVFLIKNLNERFRYVSKMIKLAMKNNIIGNETKHIKIKSIIITPLSILYQLPSIINPNRVLREFDHTKFVKVTLRDEDNVSKFQDGYYVNLEHVFEYYRMILKNGFFIGAQKFFFLALTTSQMKQHSSWFVTPYFLKESLIGPDYIRDWLGDFSKIKNIGKYATRLGQPLSSTSATINIYNYKVIDDVIVNNYVFTDGIGIISYEAARKVSQILNLSTVPSAFQIRMAGFKGVLAVHQKCIEMLCSRKKEPHKDSERKENGNDILEDLKNSLLVDRSDDYHPKKVKVSDFENDTENIQYDVIFRKSMEKFDSNHNNLEVITYSCASYCYLNKQIIMLLEGLGVDFVRFIEYQDNYILNVLDDINKRPKIFLKKTNPIFSIDNQSFDLGLSYRFILKAVNKSAEVLAQKNRIFVKDGVVLMGIVDELEVLNENEVFLMIKDKKYFKGNNKVVNYGSYSVITGKVVIVKNPCHHPGDVRVVNAIDDERLHYLKEVLVFSRKGERPVFNMCSGSDLDGDVYSVIWDDNLIPKRMYPPTEYEKFTTLEKDVVSIDDVINFYIRYIRNFNLGRIAFAHMVNCDKTSIFDENSILLADIFNKSVDFPRTGFCASVPESLVPETYPDFMEFSAPSYKSFKALGILYRRSMSLVVKNTNVCHCKNCLLKVYSGFSQFYKRLIRGIPVEYKYYDYDGPIGDELIALQKRYKDSIFKIFYRYGIKDEDTFLMLEKKDQSDYEKCSAELSEMMTDFLNNIKAQNINITELFKLSECILNNIFIMPWYFLTATKQKPNLKKKRLFISQKPHGFIYNESINIRRCNIDDQNLNLSKMADDLCDLKGENTDIEVVVDQKLYEVFMSKIDQNYNRIFSEVFNILFAAKFFTPQSFDLVLIFFLALQNLCKSNNRLDIAKVILKLSRDIYRLNEKDIYILFLARDLLCKKKVFFAANFTNYKKSEIFNDKNTKVVYIKELLDNYGRILLYTSYSLVLDINMVYKISSIFDFISVKPKYFKPVSQRRIDKRQLGSIVLKGMFDQYDKIRLEPYKGIKHKKHGRVPTFMPVLLNKGYALLENYKESLKEMFLKGFFDNIYDKNQSGLAKMLIISVIPGKFYIHRAPVKYINNILTIKDLSERLKYLRSRSNNLEESIEPYFFNYSEIYESNLRSKYISEHNIKVRDNIRQYTFSLHLNNVRYQVYLQDGDNGLETKFITRKRRVIAKYYILGDYYEDEVIPKDVCYEVISEDIIFDGKNFAYENEEKFMFSQNVLAKENGKYEVSKFLKGCTDFRLEVDLKAVSSNEDPLCMVRKTIFTQLDENNHFINPDEREVIYSNIVGIESKFDSVDKFSSLFDRAFKAHMSYFK